MQETEDTIIYPEVPPLSLLGELKSTCCQMLWHSCFVRAPVSMPHGAVQTQSSLEITISCLKIINLILKDRKNTYMYTLCME